MLGTPALIARNPRPLAAGIIAAAFVVLGAAALVVCYWFGRRGGKGAKHAELVRYTPAFKRYVGDRVTRWWWLNAAHSAATHRFVRQSSFFAQSSAA